MVAKTTFLLLSVILCWLPSIIVAKESVIITIFVPGQEMSTSSGGCRLDLGSAPVLRIEEMGSDSSKTIVTIPLRDGAIASSDNDVVPGTTGCIITKTVNLDETADYSVTLNKSRIATLQASTLADTRDLTMILTSDGVSEQSSDQWLIPTPAPTPVPSPTPLPSPTPAPAGDQGDGTYLLRGYLILFDRNAVERSGECYGAGGYSDIGSGVKVVVRDGNNNIMGVGTLIADETSATGQGCSFAFDVEVEQAEFYQVEIGHRGEMVYSFEELEDRGWIISLSLGN